MLVKSVMFVRPVYTWPALQTAQGALHYPLPLHTGWGDLSCGAGMHLSHKDLAKTFVGIKNYNLISQNFVVVVVIVVIFSL